MNDDNDKGKKSNERRRSARSPDLAKKVLEDMTSREAEVPGKRKDEASDDIGPDAGKKAKGSE